MARTSGPGSGRSRQGGASTRPAVKRTAGTRRTPVAKRASEPPVAGVRRLQTWMSPRSARTRRGAALLAVLAMILVLLGPTLGNWWGQQHRIDALREQVARQEATVSALQKEQARWKDEAYVVSQARQRLKFVKVGETAYTVIDADPKEKPGPALSPAPTAGAQPWYGRLWDSVEVADAPAAHP